MIELLGIPPQALFGQLLLGLINGSFYALLSLGLAIIFGLLNIINFTHGAQYTLGAFVAWMLLTYAGVSYWWALLLVPLIVGAFGIVLERLLIARLRDLGDRRVGESRGRVRDGDLEPVGLEQAGDDPRAPLGLVAIPASPDDQCLAHDALPCAGTLRQAPRPHPDG